MIVVTGFGLLDLRENRRAPPRILRIDDGDAVGLNEDRGVAAAAFQHIQVVFQLFNFHDSRRLRAGRLLRGL
jgi:hypothetical protein